MTTQTASRDTSLKIAPRCVTYSSIAAASVVVVVKIFRSHRG